jgi:hypothetical protein
MNRILAYAALSFTIFAGVPMRFKMSVAKKPPIIAKESPIKKVNESVVPIISFNLCSFFAPYACPIRIELPDPIPMEKETSKKKSGKNAEMAATASSPIHLPTRTMDTSCPIDCKILLSKSGTRKMDMVFTKD